MPRADVGQIDRPIVILYSNRTCLFLMNSDFMLKNTRFVQKNILNAFFILQITLKLNTRPCVGNHKGYSNKIFQGKLDVNFNRRIKFCV